MTKVDRLQQMPHSVAGWAIVTPSYEPDFERCKLLCKSIDFFVTGLWHHYIVVSYSDLNLFSSLAGPNRSIIVKETLLPKGMAELPRVTKIANSLVRFIKFSVWHSWSTGLMVGWQVQQLIKIEIACRVPEKGIICCDSDIFFVKPFDVSVLSNGKAFRFFRRAELQNRKTIANPRFLISAAKLLGLKGSPFPAHDYVDQLVTWHGPTVLAMVEHIRKASNRDWRATLGRRFFLSEYTVYGLFADRVLTDRTQLVPTSLSLAKMIWNKVDWDDEKLTTFFSDLSDSEVAIGAQSFIGIAIERLTRQFELASQKYRNQLKD